MGWVGAGAHRLISSLDHWYNLWCIFYLQIAGLRRRQSLSDTQMGKLATQFTDLTRRALEPRIAQSRTRPTTARRAKK